MNKLIMIAFLLLGLISCEREIREYIIPCDFEGCILVFYNIKNGHDKKLIDNRITYVIPQNGIYYTKNKFLSGSLVEYYYLDDKGGKKRVKLCKDQKGATIVSLDGGYYSTYNDEYKEYKVEASVGLIGKDTSRVAVENLRGESYKIFDSISEIILNRRLLNK